MLIDVPVRRFVRAFGVDVERRHTTLVDLLLRCEVETVLDVGANVGQFGRRLRAWGYKGRVISFEPIAAAHEALAQRARLDPAWDTVHAALGDRDGSADLLVTAATVFSSVRPPGEALQAAFPGAAPERQESIAIRRLDTLLPTLCAPHERVFLKLDTQGSEREVLAGAASSLERLVGIQLELSLVPMYEGEATLAELLPELQEAGFMPVLLEPVVFHPGTGALLQVDCVLFRSGLLDQSVTGR